MKFRLFVYALFSFQCIQGQDPIPAIGLWREHLPYNSAIDVTAGPDQIYCATPFSLFSVALTNQMVERYSRVTGLNETGISAIRFDPSSERLFIAYANSNIDIIYKNEIRNVPDIKRSTVAGDKQIYRISPAGAFCYLATGLGVIVIDVEKEEVKDTWYIGTGGNAVRVNGFASDNNYHYAATTEGLKSIPKNSSNPANHANWTLESGVNGLTAGSCSNVMVAGNTVIVEKNDSLFAGVAGNWVFLYTDGWPFTSSNVSGGTIQLCERNTAGAGRVIVVNTAGSVLRTLENISTISFPRVAIQHNNEIWLADQFECLSRFQNGSAFEQFRLNSPQNPATGEMVVVNGTFYATAGAVNDAWNYQFNGDGVYRLQEGTWTNTNRYRFSQLDSLLDFITIAIDPSDGTVWAGSYGGGLLHITSGNTFDIFKQQYLGATIGDPGSYRVSGLAFDRDKNLWISNFGSSSPLRVKKTDGTWKSFSVPFPLFENAIGRIIIDENNFKWIVAPLGNGLICFDHGSDIDNENDDRWRRLSTGTGNGGLPANDVLSVAKDKNGFIWTGTSDGIAVIQCPADIFSATGCDAILPVVPNGNFAGFLFKGQEVRDIAVDGADRKWIATKSGVYLVSPAGDKVIYGFTETNSPLLSNDVRRIAIDGKTGEVFFGTMKGICSFRSTATDAAENGGEVIVFPNPVPPGFSGSIAIRGLPADVIVKITELDGRLVFQGKALGGQMVWNGRNYKGQQAASGIYLVIVTGPEGRDKLATKIFFMQK